jgi:hypothetical protein
MADDPSTDKTGTPRRARGEAILFKLAGERQIVTQDAGCRSAHSHARQGCLAAAAVQRMPAIRLGFIRFDFQDRAAAIHACLQVDMMRATQFAGILVLDIGRGLQGIGRSAKAALHRGCFSFRDRHYTLRHRSERAKFERRTYTELAVLARGVRRERVIWPYDWGRRGKGSGILRGAQPVMFLCH